MPDLSVVIVNWNGKVLLRECLRSLEACTLDREVIVADNGSTDGSVEMVERDYPAVKLIRYRTNERFAKPNNEGMRIATGRHIFLLNNDTVVRPGALETMMRILEERPDVAIVGPRLIGRDGKTQDSCHGMVTLRTHFFDICGLDRLFPRSRFFAQGPATFTDYTVPQEVDHLMAAAVLVRREAYEKIGGFDELLTIYYNDLDWSYRFRQAGWKIWYEPSSVIVHVGGATTSSVRHDDAITYEQYANVLHFFRKHYGVTGVVLYRVLLFLGFAMRSLLWSVLSLVQSSDSVRWRRRYAFLSVRVALLGARKSA